MTGRDPSLPYMLPPIDGAVPPLSNQYFDQLLSEEPASTIPPNNAAPIRLDATASKPIFDQSSAAVAIEPKSATLSAKIIPYLLASPGVEQAVPRSSPLQIPPTTQNSTLPPGTSSIPEDVLVSFSAGMEHTAQTIITQSETIPHETSSGSRSDQDSLASTLDPHGIFRASTAHSQSALAPIFPAEIMFLILSFCGHYDSTFAVFQKNTTSLAFRAMNKAYQLQLSTDRRFLYWNVFYFDSSRIQTEYGVDNVNLKILDLFQKSDVVGKALSFNLHEWVDWTLAMPELEHHKNLAVEVISRCLAVSISLLEEGNPFYEGEYRKTKIRQIANSTSCLISLFIALGLHEQTTAFSWNWKWRPLNRIPSFLYKSSEIQHTESTLTWLHLRRLVLKCQLTLQECFDALGEFRNTLEVAEFGVILNSPITTPAVPIILPRLEALKLVLGDETGNPDLSCFFDGTIDTPGLSLLVLSSRMQFLSNVNLRPSWAYLRRLTMHNTSLEDGMELLSVCRSLEELTWTGHPSGLPTVRGAGGNGGMTATLPGCISTGIRQFTLIYQDHSASNFQMVIQLIKLHNANCRLNYVP